MTQAVLRVTVTQCLCGAVLCGANLVTYLADVVVEEDVAADLAIFVSPLRSALAPWVYLTSRLMADRRRKAQEKLLQLIKRRNGQ